MSLAKKRLTIILIWSVFIVSLVIVPFIDASAQSLWDQQAGRTGVETAYNAGTGSATDLRVFVANVVKVFLSLLGLIFLIIIIWGGYQWMTAGGNEDNVKTAKSRIKNGIIGFIIILASYAIVDFVVTIINDEVFDN
jgi:hypothetical protein